MVISQGNLIFWPFFSENRRIRAAYKYLFYIFPLEILPQVSQAVGEVDHLLLGPMEPETRAILYKWSVYHFYPWISTACHIHFSGFQSTF